jgi:hypothetical protein
MVIERARNMISKPRCCSQVEQMYDPRERATMSHIAEGYMNLADHVCQPTQSPLGDDANTQCCSNGS